MAGEHGRGRVDAVDHGRRLEPAARGRVAVEGDLEPEAESQVAGADHAYEEARPAVGAVTAVIVRPTRAGARSDTTPKAILPRARLTARSLSSIAPILRDRRGGPHDAAILPGMGDPDRRRRSRSGQIRDSLIWGVALGAASGAVLGDAIDGVGAGVGALVGAALYTPAEVLTTMSRGGARSSRSGSASSAAPC